MKKNFFKTLQIVLVMSIVVLTIMIPVTSNASFSFWSFINKQNTTLAINKKYTSMSNYSGFLNEFNGYINNDLDKNSSVEDLKINIIDKTTELQKKYGNSSSVSSVSNKILNQTMTSKATNSGDLLKTIMSTILGGLKNNNSALKSLEPNVVATNVATTAGNRSGEKYKVNLSGNIYYADLDENGKPTSNKWVVLVHGFMMNGQAMADSVGQMYLEQGFNILAPDLRGFGKSEGSVAMGYLESLDVWDWLTYLNTSYPNNCDEVIVHGVSLGGATTVFLSGLEVDGQTIKDKHVIGLVEDCGYTSMTGIVKDMLASNNNNTSLTAKELGISEKTDLSGITSTVADSVIKKLIIDVVDVGLTESNFDELQSSVNSLKRSSLPLLIVHGTKDTTVPFKNSTEIYNTAISNTKIPYVQRFEAEGEPHAFVILGNKENVYRGHVKNFIVQAEKNKQGETIDKESDYKEEKEQKTSMINTLVRALKLIKNMFSF